MDLAAQRGRLTFDMSDLPGLRGEMEQVIDGYVMWMRMPLPEGALPGGKTWMKVDVRRATKSAYGFDLTRGAGPAGADATKTLEYLRAAGDVEKEGQEELRGVPTTHYSAVVDLRRYPSLVPASERKLARRAIEALVEQMGTAEYPTEVWIDEKGFVRRTTMEMAMAVPGVDEKIDITMDYELFDFGTPVDVERPPEDDVIDLTDRAIEDLQGQQDAP